MGQTLSHGVYLPNEGERNCYAGLASNWQILNTAVGNIAEKAPLVHTHGNISNDGKVGTTANLPLITGTGGAIQAGSFGNAANTFCEGNDSRLSDARTPLSHTHTKSDVTDLFNSANTWTGNQTYSGLTKTSGKAAHEAAIGADLDDFILNMETYNWGTTQVNTPESYGSLLALNREGNTHSSPYEGWLNQIGFGTTGKLYHRYKVNVEGSWSVWRKIYTNWDNYIPGQNNIYDLGSASYQWNSLYAKRVNTQTLNGVNPGALSLPNLDSDGYIDLSSNISANSEYLYTPTSDGWLALYCQTSGFHAENAIGIFNMEGNSYRWANAVTSSINLLRLGRYHGSVMIPVRAGVQYGCWIVINSSTTLASTQLFFYEAKGNV